MCSSRKWHLAHVPSSLELFSLHYVYLVSEMFLQLSPGLSAKHSDASLYFHSQDCCITCAARSAVAPSVCLHFKSSENFDLCAILHASVYRYFGTRRVLSVPKCRCQLAASLRVVSDTFTNVYEQEPYGSALTDISGTTTRTPSVI